MKAQVKIVQGLDTWIQTRAIRRQYGNHLASIVSGNDTGKESALNWFEAQSDAALPFLFQMLEGNAHRACAAAIVLARQSEYRGIRRILERLDEEEWLLYMRRDQRREFLSLLGEVERECVEHVLLEELLLARKRTTVPDCLIVLTRALSAVRLLQLLPGDRYPGWVEPALYCGRDHFRWMRENPNRHLVYTLTDVIREEAVFTLLQLQGSDAFAILDRTAREKDASVVRSAVVGLGRCGDRRAIQTLQSIAFASGHPCAVIARQTLESLLGERADALNLLRGASPEWKSEDLLKPVLAREFQNNDDLLHAFEAREEGVIAIHPTELPELVEPERDG